MKAIVGAGWGGLARFHTIQKSCAGDRETHAWTTTTGKEQLRNISLNNFDQFSIYQSS